MVYFAKLVYYASIFNVNLLFLRSYFTILYFTPSLGFIVKYRQKCFKSEGSTDYGIKMEHYVENKAYVGTPQANQRNPLNDYE